jgi:hypothetical protein
MDIAMLAVPPGVTASAAREPRASRKIPLRNRMAIAVVPALSAVLALAPAAIAQTPVVPPQPIAPPEPGGLVADTLFSGRERLFPGIGVPGLGAQSHVTCARSDEQQNDCIDNNSNRDSESGSSAAGGAPRLELSARPRRDRTLPLRFRLSGRLKPPVRLVGMAELLGELGLDVRGLACNGGVTVAFKASGRRVARRRAFVTSNCRFRSGISIGTRRRVGRARRLKATARFGGNRLLAPVRRSITLHIG